MTDHMTRAEELIRQANVKAEQYARALQAVLLFYSPDWRGDEQRRWEELTGTREATTHSLCDFVRRQLNAGQVRCINVNGPHDGACRCVLIAGHIGEHRWHHLPERLEVMEWRP